MSNGNFYSVRYHHDVFENRNSPGLTKNDLKKHKSTSQKQNTSVVSKWMTGILEGLTSLNWWRAKSGIVPTLSQQRPAAGEAETRHTEALRDVHLEERIEISAIA